jgi:hypothetical protein
MRCVEQFDAAGFRNYSRLKPHDAGCDSPDLGGVVADIYERYVRFVAQAFQVWQNLAFARGIERGQRFIQQQKSRAHQQSPADRDALTLTAGKFAGPSIE